MRFISRLLVVFAATATLALAAGGWSDDFEAAKALAKKENKPILLDFTGSDWCGWCVKLDDEVFSKREFKTYAKDNLVLVTVDYPHERRQSKKLKEQNEALKQQFGINSYPTIVLIDAEGKKLAATGYKEGGAAAYVEHLKSLLGKKDA
jgi:protein disulfide-isomerase